MAFKNATYWSNADHWKWATEPNNREKASFLKENILPIEESGQLKFVEKEGSLFDHFSTLFVHGHTEAQMIPHIDYKGHKVVFAADLLPSTGHIPLPYVMGYDTKPLVTLSEKEKFLNLPLKMSTSFSYNTTITTNVAQYKLTEGSDSKILSN